MLVFGKFCKRTKYLKYTHLGCRCKLIHHHYQTRIITRSVFIAGKRRESKMDLGSLAVELF